MPGQKKRVWWGRIDWEIASRSLQSDPNRTGYAIPVLLPDNEPGRQIFISVTREQARELGMSLFKWGSE